MVVTEPIYKTAFIGLDNINLSKLDRVISRCVNEKYTIVGLSNKSDREDEKDFVNRQSKVMLNKDNRYKINNIYGGIESEKMLIMHPAFYSLFDGKFKDTRRPEERNLIPEPPIVRFNSFMMPSTGAIEYFRFTHEYSTNDRDEIFIGNDEDDHQCAKRANIKFINSQDWSY